jgi:Holliday junction resolvase
MRYRPKLDATQREVVEALRQLGHQVLSLAALGNGAPDLLVKFRRSGLALIEVKDGAKAPSKRKLSPDQERFRDAWGTYVVYGIESALELADALERGAME